MYPERNQIMFVAAMLKASAVLLDSLARAFRNLAELLENLYEERTTIKGKTA